MASIFYQFISHNIKFTVQFEIVDNIGIVCPRFSGEIITGGKMSYTQLYYHIIFRTKYNRSAIPQEHEAELYSYLRECAKRRNAVLYEIGGIENHLHMFISLPPKYGLSDFMREIKTASSKMLSGNPHFPGFCGWGNGYAALTYSKSEMSTVINYIKKQKEHHKAETFASEYRRFISEAGIPIDERFFLVD